MSRFFSVPLLISFLSLSTLFLSSPTLSLASPLPSLIVPSVSSSPSSSSVGDTPWFCHSRDCPSFTSHNTTLYEARSYPSYRWIVANSTGRSLLIAQQVNFMRLYTYINGYNEDKKKLDMTVPVVTRVQPGLAIANFSTGFFLPFEYQNNGAPEPMDSGLSFVTTPDNGSVAVRSFSGYATTNRALDQLLILQKILTQEQVQYDPHAYYLAVYDKPSQILNRHNEVWLILTNSTQVDEIMAGKRDGKREKYEHLLDQEQETGKETLNELYEGQ